MKNILNNIYLRHLVSFIVLLLCCIILWPVFDWLICKFISHSEFVYSIKDHIVQPIIFSAILTLLELIIAIRKERKER